MSDFTHLSMAYDFDPRTMAGHEEKEIEYFCRDMRHRLGTADGLPMHVDSLGDGRDIVKFCEDGRWRAIVELI